MAKLNREVKKNELLALLKKNGPMLPSQIVKALGIEVDDARSLGKELIDEGKVRANAENKKLLELVPRKKPVPAPEPTPVKKKKAKAAPEPDEDEDEDDDTEEAVDPDDEGWDEDADTEDDPDEAEDADTEDDPDADDPDPEDEVDDDDDDDPPAKKGGKKSKAQTVTPADKAFTMPFKPIDTLTNNELVKRIEDGTEAAESAHDDGFIEVAEMLMRSVARARKQLNKRG